jgi:DegV family protein with EDD domain
MVKIIADTLSCLSLDLVHSLGIDYIPQIIEFSAEESYRDDTEIDSQTFIKKLRLASALPKTAAPPPALYSPVYKRILTEGHTAMVIAPSGKVSGTVRSAEVAAKDFPGADIRVVDTNSVGSGLGVLALKAHEWACSGIDADTITSWVQEMAAREHIYFLVDTLEYLQKGGRIGKAKALVGSLLQVKPILSLKNGQIEPVEQQRTKRKAVARLRELVLSDCPHGEEGCLSVMHGGVEEDARELVDFFKAELGIAKVPVYFIPPAILVHAGPGALAVSYFTAKH